MKNFYFVFLTFVFIGLITQGFSCGSPEFESAKLAYSQNKDTEAIQFLDKELKKNPDNGDAWCLLGELKGKSNDYEGMNFAFNRALNISTTAYGERVRLEQFKYWGNHMNAAVPFMKREGGLSHDYEKAVIEYEKAAAAWPDTSITYRYMAIAYNGKGDIDNAIVNFKKAWDIGHDTISYGLYGRFLLQRGLTKKEKFELDSVNAKQLKLKKNLKEIGKGSLKSEVSEAFGAPDTKKKDSKNSKLENWVYNKHGLALTIEGDRVVSKKINKQSELKIDSTMYKEAVKDFNGAIDVFEMIKKTNPGDNENLTFLLQAYVGADCISEATKTFKLAVENDPGNKTNHYILGVLYRAIQDYTDAIAEFKEAINIDPEYSDAIYDIGATYYNWGVKMKNDAQDQGSESTDYRKKFQEALPWMEKASQIKEDDSKIWNTLGTIYTVLGQKDKAEKAYNEVDRLHKAGK
jgi:tetratricopeptide (TPR) repeat protein